MVHEQRGGNKKEVVYTHRERGRMKWYLFEDNRNVETVTLESKTNATNLTHIPSEELISELTKRKFEVYPPKSDVTTKVDTSNISSEEIISELTKREFEVNPPKGDVTTKVDASTISKITEDETLIRHYNKSKSNLDGPDIDVYIHAENEKVEVNVEAMGNVEAMSKLSNKN